MDARPLFTAAATAYLANCALGSSVALRLLDTSRFRWLHHGIFIVTSAATIAALLFGASGAAGRSGRQAAALLAPAVVPLAVIPYAGTRGRRHIRVALSAAPFFLAGLIRVWR